MQETLSIVIPTLNEEKNIKNCLNSILKQNKKPLEIIVIDNGSKDKTIQIVKNLQNKFKKGKIKLEVFYCPYGNQTTAREFGIKKSKGSIIGSLDAEANLKKDWVSIVLENFKDKKTIGLGGKSSFRNKSKRFNSFYSLSYYLLILLNLYCLGGGNSAFRKSAFYSVKGYLGLEELRKKENIKYAKDDYFLSKKFEKLGKLKFCPEMQVTLLYRVRDNQTKTYKKYLFKDVLRRPVLEVLYNYKISNYFKKL